MGVGEAGEGVGLLAEAGAGGLVGEGALGEDLQGDVPIELVVVGAVDLAHAPGAEALDDAVVVERAADHTGLLGELERNCPEGSTRGRGAQRGRAGDGGSLARRQREPRSG